MNFMPQLASIPAQRAVGRLDLAFARDGARTRVRKFYQEGCLKARLPRPADESFADAVAVNISGGVAGGDSLDVAVTLAPGARLRFSAQAAERVYRALEAPARITTRLQADAGAVLDYLPQETIVFDGFGLARSLEIDLAPDADYLGIESLVFGRRAMGETVRGGHLRDHIRLRRGGNLIWQDMTRLSGDIAAQLSRRGVAAGAGAVATIVHAAPDAPARLAPLRAALEASGLTAGASCFEGILLARILAPDAASLRHCAAAALLVLRNGRALPKLWGER